MRRAVLLFQRTRGGILVWLAGTLVTEGIGDMILHLVRGALGA